MKPDELAKLRAELLAPRGTRSLEAKRAIRCGRGAILGLHKILTVVLADLREPGPHVMPLSHVHVTIWVDENPEPMLPEVTKLVRANATTGNLVTFELRRATWWHRLVGWWRLRRFR